MKYRILFLLLFGTSSCLAWGQSDFFRQYWLDYKGWVNNNKDKERTRVNDRQMSVHPTFFSRFESQVNGLAILEITDTIRSFARAELFCEMWGGHPKTSNKRFQINGGKVYNLPGEATRQGHCEYIFPVVPVEDNELVMGNNAIQFACDRGDTFWGHFLIEEVAVNAYFMNGSPVVARAGLAGFRALPEIKSKILDDEVNIKLACPVEFYQKIKTVHYFARYSGYDDAGTGTDYQWHGYQFKRQFRGHLGSANAAPFEISWNTRMVPDQSKPMSVMAIVEFENGFFYRTEALHGLVFPADRPQVQIYYCTNLPKPFWSRDNKPVYTTLELPPVYKNVEAAELHIRVWDGGEGTVKNPFTINKIPYKITIGNAPHDLIYSVTPVSPENLKAGLNDIFLLSDTEHHGIEVCLPGPAIIVRYKK